MTIIFVTLQYTLRRTAHANTSSAPVHCPNMQLSFHTILLSLQARNFEVVFFIQIFILKILQACIKHNFHIPTLFSYLHDRFLLFRVSFYHYVSFTFWPCWGLVSLITHTTWRTSLCTPYVFMQSVLTARFQSIRCVWMFGFKQLSAAVLLAQTY